MSLSELPVVWANYVSIAGFLFLAVLVWSIPRDLIYQDSKDDAGWRDIRWWATVLIAAQLVLYSIFT